MLLFEDKKRKVINEVHGIQNQISELALKNSNLEIENKELEDRLSSKE
jgi:regulator of replication initiation timing